MIRYVIILTISLRCLGVNSQRVAPGVPPQHYQQGQGYQNQPQQYHEQVQPQYQQPQQHQQYQQPQPNFQPPTPVQQQAYHQNQPQQQQQQQQQYQQPVHQEQQGHQQKVLNAANLEQERGHIQEHMDVPIDTSKMSEAELQFHYFKMHDSDNNNKLDGCELIKSLIHWHEADQLNNQKNNDNHHDDHHDEHKEREPVSRSDETLTNLIDPVLKLMDTNKDGYISWHEYKTADSNMA